MRIWQEKFHREADTSGISMRTRLLLYWFFMALAVVAAVLAILSAVGVLSHSARQFSESLTIQQQNTTAVLDSQMDELTAQGVALSEKLGKELDAFLAGSGMAFSELNDDPDAITALEQRLYAPLSSTLSAAACSGVFCCLDVTANTGLEEASSSRAGLYLRYSGLQPTTASEQNLVCFRGIAEAARRLQLQLHNRWNPELNLSLIPGSEAVMASRDGRLAERCLWTERVALSDTWEKVVLLCVPLLDGSGTVRGFCGLEISDLYFSLSHAAVSSPYGSMVTLLAPVEGNSLSLAGALLGGTDGSRLTAEGTLHIKEGKYYTTYSGGRETYLGTHQLLDAATSDGVPLAAVTLVPDSAFRQQERNVRTTWIVGAAVFLLVMLALAAVLSHRFVRPINKSLAAAKGGTANAVPSGIPEIDEMLALLRQRTTDALPPNIEALLHSFAEKADTLTGTERSILQYYIDGYAIKDIPELSYISANTVKTHNRNIYRKMGINSFDELKVYIDLFERCGRSGELLHKGE